MGKPVGKGKEERTVQGTCERARDMVCFLVLLLFIGAGEFSASLCAASFRVRESKGGS